MINIVASDPEFHILQPFVIHDFRLPYFLIIPIVKAQVTQSLRMAPEFCRMQNRQSIAHAELIHK